MRPDEEAKREEILRKTESRVRHIGYVIFFGLGSIIFFPMILGAIQGIQQDRVWDPFTNLPVSTAEDVLDCRGEAGDLIYLAGQKGEFDNRWEQRYRRWVSRCQQDHLELFDILTVTRKRLRGAEAPPEIEVDG